MPFALIVFVLAIITLVLNVLTKTGGGI